MDAFGKRKGGGRRSAERQAAPLIAIFTTTIRSHGATLQDISRTGARLRGCDLPQKGEDFILTVEGVRAFGSVVWSKDGECGVAFDGPLPVCDFESLRHKVATAGGLSPDVRAAQEEWELGVAR